MVDCFVRVNFQQLHEVCVDLIHSIEVVVLLFEELEGEARLRIENDLERPLIISVPLVEPVQYITFQLKALCLHLVLPALLNSSANRFRRAEAKQIFSCGNHVVLIEHAIFDGLARRPFPGVVLESVEALLDIVLVSSLDEVIQHFQLGDLKQLNFGGLIVLPEWLLLERDDVRVEELFDESMLQYPVDPLAPSPTPVVNRRLVESSSRQANRPRANAVVELGIVVKLDVLHQFLLEQFQVILLLPVRQ